MDLSQILWALQSLTAAIQDQTAAMHNLAESNHQLAQAMLTPPDDDPDAEPQCYMDGTRI